MNYNVLNDVYMILAHDLSPSLLHLEAWLVEISARGGPDHLRGLLHRTKARQGVEPCLCHAHCAPGMRQGLSVVAFRHPKDKLLTFHSYINIS